MRITFWGPVSCGKVEVYGLRISKILLSWQVQIQGHVNSSVGKPSYASEQVMAEWTEAKILLGGVQGCREPVGNKLCKLEHEHIFK